MIFKTTCPYSGDIKDIWFGFVKYLVGDVGTESVESSIESMYLNNDLSPMLEDLLFCYAGVWHLGHLLLWHFGQSLECCSSRPFGAAYLGFVRSDKNEFLVICFNLDRCVGDGCYNSFDVVISCSLGLLCLPLVDDRLLMVWWSSIWQSLGV